MRKMLAALLAFLAVLACAVPAPAAGRVALEKIVPDRSSVIVGVGKSALLHVTVRPGNAADRGIVWSSSDESVAAVRGGTVTGVSPGTAVITAASDVYPSISAEIRVQVVIPVESITVRQDKLVLAPGATWEQIAYVMPESATIRGVRWTTSDKRVAVVDGDGVVTALSLGNCTVTGTAQDESGVKVSVPVRVRKHELVITKPGSFEVEFDMTEDEGTRETVKNGQTVKETYRNFIRIDNGCVERVNSTTLRPVAAGSDTVHVIEVKNGKTVRDVTHLVYVAPSAVREAGAVPADAKGGEILFRDIPWGSTYTEVRKLIRARGEKFKPLAVRNNLLWTQIDGEITFGSFTAFRNGLSFGSESANVDDLTANLQKTYFCMGDYYFGPEIPFDNLKQNVMKTYGLPANETTLSGTDCLWKSGRVTVHLFAKSKFTQLQISYVRTSPGEDGGDASGESADE